MERASPDRRTRRRARSGRRCCRVFSPARTELLAVETLDLAIETPPELVVAGDERFGLGREMCAAAVMASARALHEAISKRPLGVDEVGQRMAIRPSDTVSGGLHRAGRVDRAKEPNAAISKSEPRASVQPDLVLDP